MHIATRTKNVFKNRNIFNFGKLSENEIEKVSYQSTVGKKTRDEINKIVSINKNTKKAIM